MPLLIFFQAKEKKLQQELDQTTRDARDKEGRLERVPGELVNVSDKMYFPLFNDILPQMGMEHSEEDLKRKLAEILERKQEREKQRDDIKRALDAVLAKKPGYELALVMLQLRLLV